MENKEESLHDNSAGDEADKNSEVNQLSESHQDEEMKDANPEPKRKVRELGYLSKDNIIEGQGQEIVGERQGGLDFYRARHENLTQRKKHGHLENFGTQSSHKLKEKKLVREFVDQQLKKRLLNDASS